MSDTYVYRAFDADGRLLYVGMTGNLASRWAKHRGDSQWASLTAGYRIVGPFTTREAAARYERQAICAERPAYNVHHIAPVAVPPVDIDVLNAASARTSISAGALYRAYNLGQLDGFSDSSLLDWISTFPNLRDTAAVVARRRRPRGHLRGVTSA